MTKKVVFFALFLIIAMPCSVYAYGSWSTNILSTDNSEYNITFNATPYSEIVYITVPRRANVTVATWIFTGYSYYSSDLNYTENLTEYTSNGGPWDNIEQIFDNDWSTMGRPSIGNSGNVNLNYTKTSGSFNATWQIKDGCGEANLSVPRGCWDTHDNTLQLRIYSANINGPVGRAEWWCTNGSGEVKLRDSRDYCGGYDDRSKVYEEAIWWNMSYYPENVTIDVANNNEDDYTNTTEFNTSETINLNLTSINSYLHDTCTADWITGNCDVPFNVSSATAGVLEISSIALTGEYLYAMYDIMVYDELTADLFNTSNMTLTAFCKNDTQEYTMTNHTYNDLYIDCDLTELKLSIPVQTTDSHWRTLLTDMAYDETVRFYMINETGGTIRKQNYIIYDVTGNYLNGSATVTKNIEDTGSTVLIEQDIDAENKVILHLIDEEKYSITIYDEDGGNARIIGNIIADSTTTKRLVISNIPYSPTQDLLVDDVFVTWDWDDDSQYIRGTYNDTLGETTSVTFTVYNATNTSQILYTDTSTASVATFTYNNADINGSYVAVMEADNSRYGSLREEKIIEFEGEHVVSGLAGLGYSWYMGVAGGFLTIFIMLSFGRRFAKVGSAIAILLFAMFMFWGWFSQQPQITWVMLTLISFIVILAVFLRRRKQ